MNAMFPVVAGLLLAAGAGAQAQAQSDRMDKAFEAWDTDHNGVLSRAEFEAGWRAVVERGIAARLRAQFEKLDRNDDNGLDGAEYASLALVMQAGKDAPALAVFDANGDKRLQFDEYIASVRTLAAAARKQGGTQP
jgi:Ca2+-binding EF-hand superfamily protein